MGGAFFLGPLKTFSYAAVKRGIFSGLAKKDVDG